MNIQKNQLDPLNAVITIEVNKADYAEKVEKTLTDYRKNANIPGFRKGQVPMSLIQKQYGRAILAEEVNKLLQTSLNDYLVEEKLDILGNPLPKVTEDFNWDSDDFTFEFELGLAPEFSVDLAKSKVTKFEIVADDKMLDEQVERIQKQYGKMIPQDKVTEDTTILGTFSNEENGINNTTTITLDIFNDKKTAKQFVGKKVGDVVALGTKGLFDDDHKLMDYLKVGHDGIHGLDITVDFKIEEINAIEKAEINQELLDKLFGEGVVSSVEELKAKIKEDAEAQFAQQADQKFLNDVIEGLIENTKFDLPAEFLKKWIQNVGETPLSAEQAEVEYEKSEKGLRYQLIENKIITDNEIKIDYKDVFEIAKQRLDAQFRMYSPTPLPEDQLAQYAANFLQEKENANRIFEEVKALKVFDYIKSVATLNEKEIAYNKFTELK